MKRTIAILAIQMACCLLAGLAVSTPARAQTVAAEPPTQNKTLGFIGAIIGKQFQTAQGGNAVGGLFGGKGAGWEVRVRDDGRISVPLFASGSSLLVAVGPDGRPHGYLTNGIVKREGSLEIGNSGFRFAIDGVLIYGFSADTDNLHLLIVAAKSDTIKLYTYQRLVLASANPRPDARPAATSNQHQAEQYLGFGLTAANLDAAIHRESGVLPPTVAVVVPTGPKPAVSTTPPAETAVALNSGPRLALVIGNASYGQGFGNLANPVADTQLIARSLRIAGFEVEIVNNVDQKEMKRAFIRFGERLAGAGKGVTGLFYYAGHGIQSRGINYLIPVNAAINSEADIDIEAVTVDAVVRQMDQAGAATSIVILDACRNLPVQRLARDGTRGLARMEAPNGSYVAYSTAPGAVALDGAGSNSPFALALAAEMVKPGEPIEAVFRNVRRAVLEQTAGRQTPWDSSSLIDSFVFVR